jgi:hypothetical protein
MRELSTQETRQINGGIVPILVFIGRAIAVEYLTSIRHAH